MQRERLRKKIDNYFSKNKTPHRNTVNETKSKHHDSLEKSFNVNRSSYKYNTGYEATTRKTKNDKSFSRERSFQSSRSHDNNRITIDTYKERDEITFDKSFGNSLK